MEPIPFKQLPTQLQNAVNSSDTNVAVAAVATKFNLDEDKEAEISYLTIHLLLGLLPRNELESALSEALNVTPDISRDIAEELDMKVFAKVQTELDTLYKNRTFSKNISSSLPPPPPPPPGARRSIPIRDLRATTPAQSSLTSNSPISSYRPIQPILKTTVPQPIPPPPVPPSSTLATSDKRIATSQTEQRVTQNNIQQYLPTGNAPKNLPVVPAPAIKTSPFNTPGMLTSSQKTTPGITPPAPKPLNSGPISDILSAKLTGITQATNSASTISSSSNPSRGYGSVDPYREPAE